MKKMIIALALITSIANSKPNLSKILKKNSEPITFTTKTTKTTKSNKIKIPKLVKDAKKFIGVKYKYGGTSKRGIDCSGFVKTVFKKHKVNLPRTTRQQIKKGKRLSKKNSKVGDAIFFGDSKHRVGHVGIIIDPDKKLMIHASSARGKVIISSYDTKYYKRKFRGIRRYS